MNDSGKTLKISVDALHKFDILTYYILNYLALVKVLSFVEIRNLSGYFFTNLQKKLFKINA